MTRDELIERTMSFAVRVLNLVEAMPRGVGSRTIANQLARSGTSVASNYRAAVRAKSRDDFIYKIKIVLEEVDESACWIEMARRKEYISLERSDALAREAEELTRIFSATLRTTASGQ